MRLIAHARLAAVHRLRIKKTSPTNPKTELGVSLRNSATRSLNLFIAKSKPTALTTAIREYSRASATAAESTAANAVNRTSLFTGTNARHEAYKLNGTDQTELDQMTGFVDETSR